MTFLLFLAVNSVVAVVFEFATALPPYGASRVASGHHDALSIVEAIVGIALLLLLGWAYARHRRTARASLTATCGPTMVASTVERER
jgi:hypothetical protein